MKPNNIKRGIAITIGSTLTVAAVLWFSFLGPIWNAGQRQRQDLSLARTTLATEQKTIRSGEGISSELAQRTLELEEARQKLVTGDKYLWILRTLNEFRVPGALEFDFIDEPVTRKWPYPSPVPFDGATFLVKGVGQYQNLGLFMAELENEYPGLRFCKVEIAPTQPPEEELVAFTLEIAGIVYPSSGLTMGTLRTAAR